MDLEMREDGRFANLKLAFSVVLHHLLTACPREVFVSHLSCLKPSKQDALYKLYTQMASYVQKTLEEEFLDICEETKVAEALDDEALLLPELDSTKVRERVKVAGRKKIIDEKVKELEYLKQTLTTLKEQNQASMLNLKSVRDEVEASDTVVAVKTVMAELEESNAKLDPGMPRQRTWE